MAEKLLKIECDPKCGFMVQSHDEKEVIDVAREHARKKHGMSVSEKDAREMLKQV